jgi:type II secretory pathway component HofQ
MANIKSGSRIEYGFIKKKTTETSCGVKTKETLGTFEMTEFSNTR